MPIRAKRNIGWPVRKRTVGGVVREAATVLVRHRNQHIWVGNDQAVAVQETRGSGGGCGDIFFDMGCHSGFQRLPGHSHGRNTTSRALPEERVEPRAPPALGDASRVRVGCTPLRCWAHSPRVYMVWRLNYSVKLHRAYFDNLFLVLRNYFAYMLHVVRTQTVFFHPKPKGCSFFA